MCLSLLEAAACMRPAITSELDAYRELLEGGGFYTTQAEDAVTFADVIESVLLQKDARLPERLRTSRDIVRRVADQNSNFAGIVWHYNRLLDRHAAPLGPTKTPSIWRKS
jgi:glycosyltransferase involved in cell wall biosynthesis